MVGLDGISWSIYNGLKLELMNNYQSTKYSTIPTITVDNNIVKLNGVVVKYYRKSVELKNPNEMVGCYNKGKGLSTKHPDIDTRLKCASKASKIGDQYIGMSDGNVCHTGNFFGENGSSRDCLTKCNKDTGYMCGGRTSQTVYDASLKTEVIAILPYDYRPSQNSSFLCGSKTGTTRVDVMKTGKIIWIGTDNGPNISNPFSLANISFLTI